MALRNRKPTFFWQAALITAPVGILLLLGLTSLRQDKLLARREAADRAQRLAEELLTEGVARLTDPGEQWESMAPLIQVDGGGQLLCPPPVARLIPKPLLADLLTLEQTGAWRTARTLEAAGNDPGAAIAAYTRFLELQPPSNFAGNATYSLGLLYAARGEITPAVTQFNALVERQTDAAAESGLPLWTLACWKLVELQAKARSAEQLEQFRSFCSNVVNHPTPLTAALLRDAARCAPDSAARATLQEWTKLWRQHELARALYTAAEGSLTNTAAGGPPPAFWFSFGNAGTGKRLKASAAESGQPSQDRPQWLAVRSHNSLAGWFRCWPEEQAEAALKRLADQIASTPRYFGIELRVAGRTLVASRGLPNKFDTAPAEARPELLASGQRSGQGTEWLAINVYLSRPALLYEHQRTRRFWFGALIASSAAAVLIGLVANWRAFQRQERLSELKSNFVSSVSHELRTPIASVQLLVEGLESRRVSGRSKRQQYFRLIRQECRRLSALIENILDLSRIEQGRKEFELEPTDIIALVEQTVKIIEPYAAERKVALAVSLPASEIWPVKPRPSLDRGSIEQALLNLVDNAIKHSPEGQTVTIGLELADSGQEKTQGQKVAHPHTSAAKPRSPGPMFLIWVEDRGAGIPPEEHERIFEQFYRRGSELRRETQGVGIGLGIMKHIVESHGGRVLVRSAAGQGSRFTMVLPMNSQPADVAHEGS